MVTTWSPWQQMDFPKSKGHHLVAMATTLEFQRWISIVGNCRHGDIERQMAITLEFQEESIRCCRHLEVAMATLKGKWRQRWNSSMGFPMLAFKRGILVISCPFRTLAFLAYKFTNVYRKSILFSLTYLFFILGSPSIISQTPPFLYIN